MSSFCRRQENHLAAAVCDEVYWRFEEMESALRGVESSMETLERRKKERS